MNIIFNHAITNVRVHPKLEAWYTSYKLIHNYKRRIGYKFLLIPIYEKIPKAIIKGFWPEEFVCSADEFNHSKIYLDGETFYYKPHCTLWLNNKSNQEIFFDTVEDLNKYVDNLISMAPHIICE
jgi:hypothetical protein